MRVLPLLLTLAPLISICQSYEPLKSEGTIPNEFVTKSSEKYLKEKQNIAKSTEEKKSKKVKSNFYLESTFSVDNLLRSGYVLFNDPVTEYVNSVAEEILHANPDINNDIRFYTLKSTAVNAFSTSDGIVIINLGLIAQLENEAQLAFILCHEISHILEKHAMENYIHVEEVKKGKGVYKELTFDEKVVAHLRYSKDNEEEADVKGFELYANTKYSLDALSGVFDVLQYAHLPIDNVPFDFGLLESENLIFPEEYKLTEVNPINTEENEDDDESTHPSIPVRRQYIADAIKGKSNDNRLRFVHSEEEFKTVQAITRNELMRLYVNNRDYEAAIYHGSIMLGKDAKERQYIEEAIGRALYGLAHYKAAGDFSDVHLKPKNTEGYLHQVSHLFENLKKDEVATVALRYMLALESKYPDNPSNSYYAERLVKLIVQELDIKWDYFLSETLAEAKKKAEETAVPDSVVSEKKEDESKYDKIKKQTVAEAPKTNFIRYALAEYKSDPGLKKLFTEYKKEEDKEKPLTSKQKKAIERRGQALGIDKVLVFDPLYAFIDERKKESYRYLESEKGQEDFAAHINDISDELDLNIAMLDLAQINSGDIEKFNDFAFLTEYVNERLDHPDGMNISTIERERVQAFIKKHGTKYVNLTALVYLKQKPFLAISLTYSILFPVLLPFTLPSMISSGKNCYYLSLLYNLETDKLEFSEGYNIRASDHAYLVKSHIYHSLHQIKSAKK